MMHRRTKILEFLKICPICEGRFVTRIFEKIYCSKECKLKFEQEESLYAGIDRLQEYPLKSANKIAKICPICENQFETTYSFKKYCSKECANIAQYHQILDIQKKKQKPKKKDRRICKFCRKNFLVSRSHQKFCSEKCREKFYDSFSQKPTMYWEILNRDNFKCQYCGRNPTQHNVILTFDHIKPQIDGGKTELDNLVTTCEECNYLKSSTPLRHEAEFKKRLKTRNHFINPQIAFDFYFRPIEEKKNELVRTFI